MSEKSDGISNVVGLANWVKVRRIISYEVSIGLLVCVSCVVLLVEASVWAKTAAARIAVAAASETVGRAKLSWASGLSCAIRQRSQRAICSARP